jgi:hypothetical protein
VNCTSRLLIVRVLLLSFAALPAWSAGRALAAGLDDKAAGELQEAKRLYKSGRYEDRRPKYFLILAPPIQIFPFSPATQELATTICKDRNQHLAICEIICSRKSV